MEEWIYDQLIDIYCCVVLQELKSECDREL